MSMRFVSIAGVCLAVLTLALSGCEKKTESPPVKIGAIFAVTGPASFPGVPEAKTAEMLVERINQSGGVNGRQLLLVMKDSGSKPDNAISLAQQLIDEEKVLAIIGSSTSGETLAIKNICQEAKTILISCAAAEDIVNPIASNDGYGMAGKAQLEKLAPESGITQAGDRPHRRPHQAQGRHRNRRHLQLLASGPQRPDDRCLRNVDRQGWEVCHS